MVRKRDRFWEYAEDLKGSFNCKFCNKKYSGGVARVKSHLSQQEGRDIAICLSVPDDVKASALLAIRVNEDSNKRIKIGSVSSHVEEGRIDSSFDANNWISGLHQAPGMCHKKDKESVDKELAKFFLMNNISFNVVQDSSLIEFCMTLSNYGIGYSVPSYSTLCTESLPNVKVEVDDYVSKVKKSWTQMRSGCTLMSDGWTDLKGRSFINMIAYSPKGSIFLKSFEETSAKKTDLRDLFCYAIKEIGAENVVQIITDNPSNYESVGQMVMERYPHIYKTRCAAHGIQLLLKDIYKEVDWVRNIFDVAKDMVDYMYKDGSVVTLMRKMTSDKELKRPCKTRFAYHFLMLQSILEVKDELRQMVALPEWRNMKYYTSEMTQKITNIIEGTTFWRDGEEVIFALEPLIRVLRLVDGEGSTAGYLYEAIERAREALKHRCDNNQAKYMKLWELFELRRDRNIFHCVHAVAAYLNPLLMSSGKITYDHPDVKKGLLFVVEKMLSSSEEQEAFSTQIIEYNTQSPDIFTTLTKHQMKTIHPRVWWSQNGGPISMVQKIAIRILSQPCSSSICERNWSAFEVAQIKKRNKLTPDMLEDLIHIRMNSKMEANCGECEKRDTKIINLEQLGEIPEYIDDGQEEFENVEEASTSCEDILFDEPFRSSSQRIVGHEGKKLQLHFKSRLPPHLFTGGKVEGEQGAAIHVVLRDVNTGYVVQAGPKSTAKLNVVVLEGDFNDEDWTKEHFENHEVKEREGKRPLLTGDLQVTLKEGLGTLGDLSFTDNSSWIRSREFRLGVKVAHGYCDGIHVREAKTEAFAVKDHSGELYEKHYPPALHDEVWRLDGIEKDGALHKKLIIYNILTIEDFLGLLVRDLQRLRTIFGSGMFNWMWENTVKHAKTCVLDGKLYIYYSDETCSTGAVFNRISELRGLFANGRFLSLESLSHNQKVSVDSLVKRAYENWNHVVDYDGNVLLDSMNSHIKGAEAPVAPGADHNPVTDHFFIAPARQTCISSDPGGHCHTELLKMAFCQGLGISEMYDIT